MQYIVFIKDPALLETIQTILGKGYEVVLTPELDENIKFYPVPH